MGLMIQAPKPQVFRRNISIFRMGSWMDVVSQPMLSLSDWGPWPAADLKISSVTEKTNKNRDKNSDRKKKKECESIDSLEF